MHNSERYFSVLDSRPTFSLAGIAEAIVLQESTFTYTSPNKTVSYALEEATQIFYRILGRYYEVQCENTETREQEHATCFSGVADSILPIVESESASASRELAFGEGTPL